MKTLKMTRRDFSRNAGLTLLSATGLMTLSTLSCSDDDSPTSPGGSTGGLTININDHAALGQVGGVKAFSYEGTPIYVFRTGENSFRALSRLCTHQSCEVDWEASSKKLICPCHGSEFSDTGAALKGPATRALPEYTTAFDAAANSLTIGG